MKTEPDNSKMHTRERNNPSKTTAYIFQADKTKQPKKKIKRTIVNGGDISICNEFPCSLTVKLYVIENVMDLTNIP